MDHLRKVGKGPQLKGPVLENRTCAWCGKEVGDCYWEEVRAESITTFCTPHCLMRSAGLVEEVTQEISRQVRRECNWLHIRVCEPCKRKIKSEIARL